MWGGILCCIFSGVFLTYAQSSNTTLRGVIKDPGGALIPGAKITITDNAKGNSLTTTSNAAGAYLFPQIPPATYTIRVSSHGFGDSVKVAELLVNQPATIDFNLTIQANTVIVDVSAVAQTLNASDASLGKAVGNAEIQALPSETRNVPDLLSLQPGALYLPSPGYGAGDSRSGAVNGGRSDQGNVTLDGVDDNDQVGGFAFTGILRATQDSIQEFRVVTGNSNADAGRSSGAQISMVTKSGTNKFHGAVYEYHRPTFTVANDWFNKQAQIASGLPNVPGKLIRNIFGGDLGGPIKKNKLFFFGNYEGVRQAENQQVSHTAPTASYQAGQVVYPDANGNPVAITSGQMAQLDSACLVCNTSIYPNPAGDNPNSLGYFKSMPAANGTNLGDGYNTGSYTFSSPAPIHLNTTIVKLDYTASERHRFFVRGNLQDDRTAYPEQFPGQPPGQTLADNSKGITAGHTWTISHSLINDIRYGYVRQGFGNSGVGKGEYVDFGFLDPPTAETRNRIVSVPVNNFIDNLSWNKGNHTLQFGANWRLIHQNNSTDANSYNSATTNPNWLGGSTPDPCQLDNSCAAGNKVPNGFGGSYQIAFANMVGAVPQITDVFNYKIATPTGGSALAEGAFIQRHFSANEFEWYAQDAWRVKPNLTLTFGIRQTILQTPWETSGQQVTPTVDTHNWYLQRETAARSSQIYEEDLQFAPAGKFYNKPGFWPMNKDNFAPRLAVAYSPDPKTSIRAGFGFYYDHFGQALVNSYDQLGSFGMSSAVTNPGGYYSLEGTAPFCGTPGCAPQGTRPAAPRFVDRSTLPPISVGTAPTTVTYPFLYPQNNFSVQWGLDSKIKTPYSETFDLSVQRELHGGVSFEATYVGRLGRHLLQQLDLAQPVDYVDPKGAGDYYAAGSQLSRDVDLNGGNFGLNRDANGKPIGSQYTVAPIEYFENVFPFMAGYDYAGESATQAIYNNEWAPYRPKYGATTSLSDIDFYCLYGCPAGWQPHFFQDQFVSLYAWSSIGMSYYHGLQLTLRHPTSHGLLFDVSYTWSHSIDMGSDAERTNELTGTQPTNTGSFSAILNTWKPYLNRASSDFDTRHLVTVDWVYALPFGRGKAVAKNANGLADAFIGGWQWSGINRWSSGLPFSLIEPGWTTDYQISSFGVLTAPVKMRKHYDQNHNPQFFDNPEAINAGVATGSPIRLPYPGEAGPRNNFRGDGYFDIDSGLAKTWKVRDFGAIHFEWEVYNVTNSVRFDVGPANLGRRLTVGNLGVSSVTLSVPRRMQFALRFDF
jgi:hypothetical protein